VAPLVRFEPARLKDAIVASHRAARASIGLYPHTFREAEEEALQLHLQASVRELDLETTKGTTLELVAQAQQSMRNAVGRTEPLGQGLLLGHLAKRADLQGLPLLMGVDCQADGKVVATMAEVSTTLRRSLAQANRPTMSSSGMSLGFTPNTELVGLLQSHKKWHTEAAVPVLVQMLQVERPMVRLQLIKILDGVRGQRASTALAQRAVFDLSPEVREAAVTALANRPIGEYRSDLLAGFRYPWPFAADHAAEALVALKQTDAVPALVDLLDQPDPALPIKNRDNVWTQREVVRVNHFRNCVLCHAPSADVKDQVRGVVPTPGQPIPVAYYESTKGDFVQATVTYIKQDFSVMHDVHDAQPWPTRQRHDYFVRTRELQPEETAHLPIVSVAYPQRDAVLLALRALTAEDHGTLAEEWHAYLRQQWTGFE
jgi:hypothetical protein